MKTAAHLLLFAVLLTGCIPTSIPARGGTLLAEIGAGTTPEPTPRFTLAEGSASLAQLNLPGVPAGYGRQEHAQVTAAESGLLRAINQEGFTPILFNGAVSTVITDGNARLCLLPYLKEVPHPQLNPSPQNEQWLGFQNGMALYGVDSGTAGLDPADRLTSAVAALIPLDSLNPGFTCALAVANFSDGAVKQGELRVLLIDTSARQVAGSLPAQYSPGEVRVVWNTSLDRLELLSLQANGQYERVRFTLKTCYQQYTPTPPPTSAPPLPTTPPSARWDPPLPLTGSGAFDWQADLNSWPRIQSQAELQRYVAFVKNNLSHTWLKPICTLQWGSNDQVNRKQLIIYNYPLCFCEEDLPIRKIAGYYIQVSGANSLVGIITQVQTLAGLRYYTALSDAHNGPWQTPAGRKTLFNTGTYLSVFGDYKKTPGLNYPNPSLVESALIFMLESRWVDLAEYNQAFTEWVKTGVPPLYFETHPAAGELITLLMD